MKQDILDIWLGHKERIYKNANRIDVNEKIKTYESRNISVAQDKLCDYLDIYDESIHFLLHLEKFVEDIIESSNEGEKRPCFTFAALLSRIINLSVSIRKLIVIGFEDSGRVLARSLCETFDLALVTAGDNNFAKTFFCEDEDYDSNQFWKDNIARGQINQKIKNILLTLGLSKKETNNIISHSIGAKSQLSSAVHSAFENAVRCKLVPSIETPGMMSLSCFGHISVHSPSLLLFVIMEIYRFGAVLVKMVTSKTQLKLFERAKDVKSIENFLVSFITLQDIIEKKESLLHEKAANYMKEFSNS